MKKVKQQPKQIVQAYTQAFFVKFETLEMNKEDETVKIAFIDGLEKVETRRAMAKWVNQPTFHMG